MARESSRWEHVERLLHVALKRRPEERDAFLRDVCGDDESLAREVASLLAAQSGNDAFLERPAIHDVAELDGALQIGDRVGVYEILECVGVGGMGEVYRARDTKLGRDVAIKILPKTFAADPSRVARFDREARLLAAINHPNIATIHEVEDEDGLRAIVMELVPGETLAAHISAHQTPARALTVDAALIIARQIAAALEAAHERGIVHRDLKPTNIKITPGGTVKVLDFGLAKLDERATTTEAGSASPTIETTREGVVLGTAAYMSPEQARGQAVDKRTDIWAFGCVLYEMLTGSAAFARETLPDTIAAILEREPDWSRLPTVPPTVVRVLRRCLEKDPRRRVRDIADVAIDLNEALDAKGPPWRGDVPSWSEFRHKAATKWIAIGVAMTAAVALSLYWTRMPREAGSATRLSLSSPGILTPQASVAVSPDGTRVAFVSTDASGQSVLWVRALDSLQARALPGTGDAAHPFWSPDGRSLGFLADGKVKRIDVDGGGVLTLADTRTRVGPTWSRLGTILFVPRYGEIASVPTAGGPVKNVLETVTQNTWPSFLPDGRHFLFVDRREPQKTNGIYVGALDSKDVKFLMPSDFQAVYADPGYLLTVRGEALTAQPFDAERREVSGEPKVVAEGVWGARGAARASFSASPTGVLAYVNSTLFDLQLTWADRSGRSLGSLGASERYGFHPQISPDGSRVAILRGPYQNQDVWILNLKDETGSRLTFSPGALQPTWSGDGRRILSGSRDAARGVMRVYAKEASGAGTEEEVGAIASGAYLWDWSRDGRFIVYSIIGRQSAADLWVLPLGDGRQAFPLVESSFHKTQAQIAPSGRWIAYTSYESGRDEVYVQSFPTPGNRRQISVAGGMQPRWRRDGRELYYLAGDQYINVVPVKIDGAFEAGRPTPLFKARILPQGSQSVYFDTQYDVTPDGQRFLFTVPPDDPHPPITIVLNWPAVMRR